MRGVVILVFLFFKGIEFVSGSVTSYEGYKVYQVTPRSTEEAQLLNSFENNIYFDFWSNVRMLYTPVDIMVNPLAQEMFQDFLQMSGIEYDILIENVEETIQKDAISARASTRVESGDVTFTEFMRYEEIVAYLLQLEATYPEIVSTEIVGQSFEGRDIYLIKVSSGGSNKTTIFAEAAIHAREWIAPPVALYVINQLVENVTNAAMYQNIDWAIIPVANPDGYEYTHTSTRLWRKTRSPATICYGIDPNRNFDYYWNLIGTSSWQCDETFSGRAAFTEYETQAIRDYVLAHKDNIKLYLAIHSYGPYMLSPWGYTSDEPENVDELNTLGELFKDAIYAVNGTNYTVGTTANALYYAAGISIDWAMGVAGIDLSYTIELPGGGSAGFDIPAERIEEVVSETWDGFKVLQSYIENKFVNDTDEYGTYNY